MSWQLILEIYLWTLLPALYWAIVGTYEDVMCYLGYKKPDHKFGYNWTLSINQSIFMTALVIMCIPMVNVTIYATWAIMSAYRYVVDTVEEKRP